MTATPPPISSPATPPHPRRVSRHYRFDWQFAARVMQAPVLRGAALTITVSPFVLSAISQLNVLGLDYSPPWQFWAIWISAVSYGAAWLLLFTFCPGFIKQYKSFSEYRAELHSHRWAFWQLYSHLRDVHNPDEMAGECISKGLASPADASWDSIVAQSERVRLLKDRTCSEVYKPVNIGRDLYVPFVYDGKRYFLAIEEDGERSEQKEKEAFWVLFSHLTRSRPVARFLFWVATGVAMVVGSIPIVWNVIRVVALAMGFNI